MSETHLTETRFESFNLVPQLLQGIEAAGFSKCTPIQAQTLPLALQGFDVAGQAQTGTGKTAAFMVATFQYLLTHPLGEGKKLNQPRCVILAPTRELAVQIHKDAEILGRFTGLKSVAVYGGTGYDTQRQELEAGVDIIIGTPGRIIDYHKQHVFDMRVVQVMVLDEADRMFDLGFIKDIRFLLRRMPPPDQRLNLLFSATLSYRVLELSYEHMNNPKQVVIEREQVTAEKIVETVYYPAKEEKIPLLLGLLQQNPDARVLIFVNTKRAGDKVTAYLRGNGYKYALLTGDVPQKKRQSLLNNFADHELHIMVATDVAARGLHIPAVSHVINYDLPQDAEDYVHRIGRTGRAGASGHAVSFACEEYVFSLPDIEIYIGHKLAVQPITADMLVTPAAAVYEREERVQHRPRNAGKPGGGQSRGKPRRHGNGRPAPVNND